MVFQWIDMGILWEIHGIIFWEPKKIIGCSKTASKVCWTSFAQLFVDFNLTFGQPGPIKVNKQWIDVANRPYISHEDINLRVKLRWFRRFVQNMLREGQVQVGYEQCREESSAIQAHVPSVSVKWSDWHRERVDAWLKRAI